VFTHDDTRGHRRRPPTRIREQDLALVADLAARLVGTPRHLSVHSGGMLITAQPLVEVVPLERATKEGVVVTQWNKDSVEDAGLIKIDLLCLRTLDLVTEAAELIAARTGAAPPVDDLSLDDPVIYRTVSQGDTIGCFQVESRAQAQMLPRLKPRRFEDIVVQVSIVRPGPIQGGMIHPYLRRRQGLEPVTYLHPKLEPILGETLGVIIFQEQVIRVAMALAGFSPGEADMLRRAMSRARSDQAMNELSERFVAGAVANGVERAVAEEAFNQLRGFATYGFCKSHAAAFALIAYQTLWLKIYYPAEFYCALLNHQPMGFYAPEVVIGDAQRHRARILRPDVNASRDEC
jgi:error-prone DNA polymerase